MENQSQAENKKTIEFVTGTVIIIFVSLVVLFFLHGNIFLSLAFTLFGTVIGGLYSRHKFQRWSSYVAWKAVEDAMQPTIFQQFLSLAYAILIWFGLDVFGKYVHIPFETITGIMEIMVGSYLGYFLWLIRLYNQSNGRNKLDEVL